MSHKARGPVFLYRSIDLNKLNNFSSVSFYKILTRKVIAIKKRPKISSGEPWTPRAYFLISVDRTR